jgi:hypothetical protein
MAGHAGIGDHGGSYDARDHIGIRVDIEADNCWGPSLPDFRFLDSRKLCQFPGWVHVILNCFGKANF